MNNIFLNPADPLLYNRNPYNQQNNYSDDELRNLIEQKYPNLNNQRQHIQQQTQSIDMVTELENKIKNVNVTVADILNEDEEFSKLSNDLQILTQSEILLLVKNKINSNDLAVKNIQRQLEIIDNIESDVNYEERQNIAEFNDYMKNYSSMTFENYKAMKSKSPKPRSTKNKKEIA